MKLTGWLIIAITILIVAALTIRIDSWANEWKDVFFYIDNWPAWIAVFVAAWVVKSLLDWAWRAEVRLLK